MEGCGDTVETFSVQPSSGCDDAVQIVRLYLEFLKVAAPQNKVTEPLMDYIVGSVVGAEVTEEAAVEVTLRLYIGYQ
jgi:hypothetical protein